MRLSTRARASGAIALFLWVFAASEAAAQTQTSTSQKSGDESGLQEVVVTARRYSENIQTVPIAITAITGDQLKNQSVNTVKDLQVPSLYIQQGFDDPQTLQLTLRGRKQNDATLAVDPSVGVYTDGFYNPRSVGMAGALLDISRVEVLRGPQGTLYGRNTTGGAISIYTNDPTHSLSGSADLTVGNYGAWNVAGILNLPITDRIDARFVAMRSKHDGYGHDGAGRELLNDDSQYYRAKVRIALSDTWTALLSGHYESTTTDGNILKLTGLAPADPASGLPEGGFATLEAEAELGLTEAQALNLLHTVIANSSSHFYDTPSIANTFSRVRRYDAGLKIEGQLTDGLQFRSFTGYQHLATQGEIGNNGVPFNILTGDTGHQDEYLSQEFQLLGGENSRFRWLVGAYGSVERGHDTVLFTVVPALGPIILSNDDRIKNTNLGAFAQATWEFAPDWHLTGGARYSKDKRRGDLTTLDNGCAVPAPGAESSLDAAQCPRRFEESFQKPVWLASLDYRLNTDTLLYAKVATGYRSGGIQEGGDTLAESFTPFRPETNAEFEAGFKTDLLNHRLRLNVAGYFDKYSDLQQTTNVVAAGGAVAQAVHNAASAHIWGVEVEADAILTNNFSVHLSGAYTHAKYTSFLDLDANGNPIDRSNQPFPVPKSTFGITPRYTFSNGLGHLSAQVDFRWQSKVVLDPAGARPDFVTQGPYGLLNARIAQHIDRWNVDVAVFGTNLTATHYYDQAVNLEDLLGVDDGYPGAPRLFGFEIIQKFGE